MRRIACGYLCVDVYPEQGHVAIGGECTNFALATAAAGEPIELAARVGDDAIGPVLSRAVDAAGVDCAGVGAARGRTSYSVVAVRGAERSFPDGGLEPYTNHPLTCDELRLGSEPTAVHLDFSSLHLLPEVKTRPNVLTSADYGVKRLLEAEVCADVCFVSLDAEGDPDALARRLERLSSDAVLVVTQGPAGSVAYQGGRRRHQPAPRTRVVDSTGAGDAYQAGFMHEYACSRDVGGSLERGTAWGAAACGHLGANRVRLELEPGLAAQWLAFVKQRLA